MSEPSSLRAKRSQMVMTMVLARLQAEGRHLGDLSPTEIKSMVSEMVEILKFSEERTPDE